MEWAKYLAGEMIYNTLSKMKTPKAIFYFISILTILGESKKKDILIVRAINSVCVNERY
jgi:hypothetical protein